MTAHTDPLAAFHPAVADWFGATFGAPTPAQARAWPAIASGRHALIAAPTGSGKTLAAFLAAIDALVRRGLAGPGDGDLFGHALPDRTFVVYVSPLKALSNDVRINLEGPLAGIRAALAERGLPEVEIRTMVRTGDTPPGERTAMRKRPPHIVVTTPESLYVLLGSASGRQMLASTESVIVDEIHALAGNKRGAHLALSLERLEALCGRRLVRIGLSATQKPIEEVARYLVGARTLAHHPHPNPPPEGEGVKSASPPEGEGVKSASLPEGEGVKSTSLPEGEGVKSGAPAGDEGVECVSLPVRDGTESLASALKPSPSGGGLGGGGVEPDAPSGCEIVDVGYTRRRDLAVEVPPAPLEAVMSGEVWASVYDRLAALAGEHRTTLVFVNTRRMAERTAMHLTERLGKEAVAAHHGSLSREIRLDAEQRLKRGELKVLVATASLELGIDIGEVELVCQLGSPRAIAAFLQRIGRSGHSVGGTPKGRIFPLSRDDLAECVALLDAVRRGELDTLRVERLALDVLAQQIVAEVASRDWHEDDLYQTLRRAWPYAALTREQYGEVVRMLAEGYSPRRGPRAAHLHRDAVHGMLRARRGARLTALTSGGAIPDTADYDVVLEPQSQVIGSVHEDFAVESMAGDVFQLGNASYRILRVERGKLRVEDAQGLPPSIPFWLGEAPGRSDELSFALSRLRAEIAARLHGGGLDIARHWLVHEVGIAPAAARQLVDYYAAADAALGVLPTQQTLAMERFFDESGGTQLIIHSPYGVRVNRAWGLALRKRFCRSFNFELQAAATDDAIILSLSTSHSFPLADVVKFLHANSVRDVLVQALLDAPMFPLRWRWNATTALALPRFSGGRRVPPQIQRMRSEDLLATVFPDQVACLENIVGERQIPDHPLVAQTLHDCLHEAMDIDALEALLRRIDAGEVAVVCRDLTEPSPLAAEILGARPYAFLDDAPLEERRTQAVQSRRWADPESAEDLGRLDPGAIAAVREEAWPEARNAEELHEALLGIGWLTAEEAARGPGWEKWLAELAAARRATRLSPAPAGRGVGARVRRPANATTSSPPHTDPVPAGAGGKHDLWIAAERLPQFLAIHPRAAWQPRIDAPAEYARVEWTAEDALPELLRARLTGLGPVTAADLAASISLPVADIELALRRLERDGYALRGRFTPGASPAGADAESPAMAGRTAAEGSAPEWCERHLLARIHRYTLGRLRREIEPVAPRDFMRFVFEWQRVAPGTQAAGPDALAAVLGQLEGYEAAAGAWESELLPLRVADYEIGWLDELSMTGRVAWTRLRAAAGHTAGTPRTGSGPVRATPIVLLPRKAMPRWTALVAEQADGLPLSSRARRVADWLREHGASFFDELMDGTRLLQAELEDALGELVSAGQVNADGFAGLRALLVPSSERDGKRRKRGRRPALFGIADAGRWSLLRRAPPATAADARQRQRDEAESLEYIVRVLLRRYGVLAWQLLQREADWLPPWRDLRRACQRMEARGELRGGRFIAGLSGEQFALPEAIGLLRRVRQREPDGTLVCVCGVDPLNLSGIVVAGPKLPSLAGARVLYRDGMPVATLVGGEFATHVPMDEGEAWVAKKELLRDHAAHLPAAAGQADTH
ncbi:ATP-dependent Lhr-like helicase [Rehaibacterium terrae]|jgi:ATP-dependent Lhr-like helicase|uniref:ATP-dependent Lhr-like helicase n=2 Tax=Rehaibacterium terrae TaxID=1341696 RepID=A0A7W8DDD0_9GAMM|nr:DEAD/DEAH box helicase [Rehaibacterium terrae]MBB5015075.1 ATP-dependent Lhr-like helicase [Rehaibacterium terrae]